jgi:hypothetical protein
MRIEGSKIKNLDYNIALQTRKTAKKESHTKGE